MTEQEQVRVEEVKEWIAQQFYGGYCELEDRDGYEWQNAISNATQILSSKDKDGKPMLGIISDDQSLPELPEPSGSTGLGESSIVKLNQKDLIKEINWRYRQSNFVKIIKGD